MMCIYCLCPLWNEIGSEHLIDQSVAWTLCRAEEDLELTSAGRVAIRLKTTAYKEHRASLHWYVTSGSFVADIHVVI